MNKNSLGDPQALSSARTVAHAAAQLLYRAAVANVAPLPAYEHTSLGWDVSEGVFQTHPLGNSELSVRLRLAPLTLALGESKLALDKVTKTDALDWLDGQLAEVGLKPVSTTKIPFRLPTDVSGTAMYAQVNGLSTLANWFELATITLQAQVGRISDVKPGSSPVRCWPHHFDMATYVSFQAGDAEHAPGIGIGMSPGDGSYDEPYFYVNPWPHLDAENLPEAVPPGHWHTDVFVGSVVTGSEILTLSDPLVSTSDFLQRSFKTGRSALGI